MTVTPSGTICPQCLFETLPSGDGLSIPRGPLGVLPGVIGAIQSTESLKLILGLDNLLTDRPPHVRTIAVNRAPHCPLCGRSRPDR